MTDEQIIQQLKSGNHSSVFKELYKHYALVRQMILKNSGNKQDAEDVFQEGVIILYRKVKEENFKLTSSIATFLFSISRYQWLNELRKRKKEPLSELKDISNEDEDLFGRYSEDESKFKKAEEAFMQIGDKCRELLQLFYYKKLDLKDIASKLGFSNEKVAKNQKYRCLEKARELYLKNNHTEQLH